MRRRPNPTTGRVLHFALLSTTLQQYIVLSRSSWYKFQLLVHKKGKHTTGRFDSETEMPSPQCRCNTPLLRRIVLSIHPSEKTFDRQKHSDFAPATLSVHDGSIRNYVAAGTGWASTVNAMKGDRMIERPVIIGVNVPPNSVAVSDGAPIEFENVGVVKVLVLRNQRLPLLWTWK